MSNSKGNQIDDRWDAPNHGLVNNQIFNLRQSNQSLQLYGANEFFMGAPNDQLQTLTSAETYPQHLGTATNNAMSQGMVLVQHPHRCDQPEGNCSNEIGDHGDAQNHVLFNDQIFDLHQMNQSLESDGANTYLLDAHVDDVSSPAMNNQLETLISPESAINMVNPSISPQMNPCPLAKPGSSQSSNIIYADFEKKIKKREMDKKYQAAQMKKMRKDNEEKLVKVTEKNNQLGKDNGRLKEGEVTMKKELRNFEEQISLLEKQVSDLSNKLKGQNAKLDALDNLLERRVGLLSTQSNNPDSKKILELHDEMENWKRKAKKQKAVIDALCDKMSNDKHERERSTLA